MALCYMGTFQSARLNRASGYPGLRSVVYERPALLILGTGRGGADAQALSGAGPGSAGAEGGSRRPLHVADDVTRTGICREDKPFVLTADTCSRRAHGISIYHVAPKSLGGYEFVSRRRYRHVLARTDNGR
jgi:hypothetical protein